MSPHKTEHAHVRISNLEFNQIFLGFTAISEFNFPFFYSNYGQEGRNKSITMAQVLITRYSRSHFDVFKYIWKMRLVQISKSSIYVINWLSWFLMRFSPNIKVSATVMTVLVKWLLECLTKQFEVHCLICRITENYLHWMGIFNEIYIN